MPQLPPWSPGGWAPGDWQPTYEQPPNEGGGNLPPVEWSPPEWQNPFNTTNPGDNTPLSSSAGTAAQYRNRPPPTIPSGVGGGGLPSLDQIGSYFSNRPGLSGFLAGQVGGALTGPIGGLLSRMLTQNYLGSQPFPGPQAAGWTNTPSPWVPGYVTGPAQSEAGTGPLSNEAYENRNQNMFQPYMGDAGVVSGLMDPTFLGVDPYQSGQDQQIIDNRPQGERRE